MGFMSDEWQCVVRGGFLSVGVRCDEAGVFALGYLPRKHPPCAPQNQLAAECARQIAAYFRAPQRHQFDLPLYPPKTEFQKRVRAIVYAIPSGQTLTYGAVRDLLKNSSARAVGGACRANPIPLIVPCHRVIAQNGVGGFMGAGAGDGGAKHNAISIKQQLLRHEGVVL